MRQRLVPLIPLIPLIPFIPLALSSLAPAIASAQSSNLPQNQQFAFTAIVLTPAGALPQLVRVKRTMDSSSRGEAAIRFGRYNFRNSSTAFSNIGGTALLHVARRFQVGGTFGYRTCRGCEGLTMGSADIGMSLFQKPASGEIGGDTDIGLQISAGMGKADSSDVTARSLTVSTPLAVSLLQPENSLLTLFLSPSLAYGRLSENGVTDGGSRFIIGAGIAYSFAFGLGVHASAHRILIEDSPTQYGLALSYVFAGH